MKKEKKFFDVVNPSVFFLVPVILFFCSSVYFGGSTGINDAREYYDKFTEGCYYLVDHGNFTQVSAKVYYFIYTLEILTLIGFICFIVMVIIMTFRSDRKRK